MEFKEVDYSAWNDALRKWLLGKEKAGKRVFLHVTPAVLFELCGLPEEDAIQLFLTALYENTKKVLGSSPRFVGDYLTAAFRLYEDYKLGDGPPPYIGYLSALVLAQSVTDISDETSVIRSIRNLLAPDQENAYQNRHWGDMELLWEELEDWCTNHLGGEEGVFVAQRRGGENEVYVGYIKGQCILTTSERLRLPQIFYKAALLPTSEPTNTELSYILTKFGKTLLTKKTLVDLNDALVSSSVKGINISETILGEMRIELLEYDPGTVLIREGSGKLEPALYEAGRLQLGLKVSKLSMTTKLTLHARIFKMPSNKIEVAGKSGERCLAYCGESEVTSKFVLEEGGLYSVPFGLYASGELTFHAEVKGTNRKLELRSQERSAFIFQRDQYYAEWIESDQFQPEREFFMLFRSDNADLVRRWGQKCCEDWEELYWEGDIPTGWLLGRASQAHCLEGLPKHFRNVTTDRKILFKGGIKSAASGEPYYSFALPSVSLVGVEPDITLLVQGDPLASGDEPVMAVANAFDKGEGETQVLIFRAKNSNDEDELNPVAKMFVRSTAEWPVEIEPHWTRVCRFSSTKGQVPDPEMVGAQTKNVVPPRVPLESERLVVLGCKRGQAQEVSSVTGFTENWEPIWWAYCNGESDVEIRFVGGLHDLCYADASLQGEIYDEESIQLWDHCIKRADKPVPFDEATFSLWENYEEVCRRQAGESVR